LPEMSSNGECASIRRTGPERSVRKTPSVRRWMDQWEESRRCFPRIEDLDAETQAGTRPTFFDPERRKPQGRRVATPRGSAQNDSIGSKDLGDYSDNRKGSPLPRVCGNDPWRPPGVVVHRGSAPIGVRGTASLLEPGRPCESRGQGLSSDLLLCRRSGHQAKHFEDLAAHTEISRRGDPSASDLGVMLGVLESCSVPQRHDDDLVSRPVVFQADQSPEIRVVDEQLGDSIQGTGKAGRWPARCGRSALGRVASLGSRPMRTSTRRAKGLETAPSDRTHQNASIWVRVAR
jgi:hypothetical protein